MCNNKPLNDAWLEFKENAIVSEIVTSGELDCLRRTFYAGFAAAFLRVIDTKSEYTEEQKDEYVEAVRKELNEMKGRTQLEEGGGSIN